MRLLGLRRLHRLPAGKMAPVLRGAQGRLQTAGLVCAPEKRAALAQAVLDELIDNRTFVLAATHFPSLKSYALTRESARAASVLFDPASKKPLYKLAYDQVGASQALDVAREYGLPESILRRAEHYLLQDGGDTSVLLARLNALAAQREEEVQELRAQQGRAKQPTQLLLT